MAILSDADFARAVQACAAAPTVQGRIDADRALTLDEIARLEASQWRAPTRFDALGQVQGGATRAQMHASYGRVCSAGAFGGGFVCLGPTGPVAHQPVALSTRLRWLNGWASPSEAFGLDVIDEHATSTAFELAPGNWRLTFRGAVALSSVPIVNATLALVLGGATVASQTISRGSAVYIDVTVTVAAAAELTLENAGAAAELVSGVLSAVPS